MLELFGGSVFAVKVVTNGLSGGRPSQRLVDLHPKASGRIFLDKARTRPRRVDLVHESCQDGSLFSFTVGRLISLGHLRDELVELSVVVFDRSSSSNNNVVLVRLEVFGICRSSGVGPHGCFASVGRRFVFEGKL